MPNSNIFLEGNYAPIREEHSLSLNQDLELKGKIPKDLVGSLYRNGPNPQFDPGKKYHWFFGDGMVHHFRFNKGNVSYQNRYVQTPTYVREKKAARSLFSIPNNNFISNLRLLSGNFGTLLAGILKNKNADVYTKLIAKSNTALCRHHDKLYALVESSPPVKINPATLESEGFEDFQTDFLSPFTAHPKLDPVSGYLYGIGYRISGKPALEFYVITPTGKMVSRTAIDIPYRAMVHDFVITNEYAIIGVFPAIASLRNIQNGSLAAWSDTEKAYLYVIPKSGESHGIFHLEIEPGYIYHFVNAYQNQDEIIIDGFRSDKVPLMGTDEDHRAILEKNLDPNRLHRYLIDLKNQTLRETAFSEITGEFPVIDPRLVGTKHTHFYCATTTRPNAEGSFNAQRAVDLRRDKPSTTLCEFPRGHFGGEPILVPTGKIGQTKGYLLNIIYDSTTDRSYLGIWDAAHIDKKTICEIWLPHRIPYGFHGLWVGG